MDAEAVAPGVVCDRDGLLARTGEQCPLCQDALREVPDVIEELVKTVIEDGGEVRHIETETDLHTHLTGALLRFELPRTRSTRSDANGIHVPPLPTR